MKVEIKVPAVGESIREGVLGRWLVPDGGYVKKGDPVFEFETDKTNAEIPAPASGAVTHGAAEGSTIEVDAMVGTIETDASVPSNGAAVSVAATPAPAPTPAPVAPPPAPVAATVPAADSQRTFATPVARAMMSEHGLDPSKVKGASGRITSKDVLSALSAPPSPSVEIVPGTARSGAAMAARGVRRERMTQLRKTIARRLVEAQHTAAMLTTFNEVDMSAVMDLRKRYKDPFKEKYGVNLGFMSFFVKACCDALAAYPRANASIDGDEVVFHDFAHIGVAVGTDRGLMVPVIRDADLLNFSEVEKTILGFAAKARDGKITLDDLEGGTFTISNGGVYGSMLSTPILNPPQSAILGMHNIVERPVVRDGQIVIRPIMYLALSYDHRLLDGKEAVGFLVRVKQCLEDPERMLLAI